MRKYAALLDKTNLKDKVVFPLTTETPSIDLREWMPPIRDQLGEGACTMFAGTAIMSWLYKKFNNESLIFSPQFGYRAERLVEGDPTQDAGAQSRTMMAVMHDTGLCLESTDPYVDSGWRTPTTLAMLQEAQKYRIGAYHRVPSFDVLKSVLASGYVASMAIAVYQSFEDYVNHSGIVPLPDTKKERLMGLHEVVACGYDSKYFIVRNSWSEAWGDKGYFYLPFEYPYVADMWTAHLGPAWVAPNTIL